MSSSSGTILKLLLGLLSIIAAVATVFSCVIAYLALFRTQDTIITLQTISGQPAPTPHVQVVVVTATIEKTSPTPSPTTSPTSVPTQTPTPTYTFTPSPTATPTSTPTATPAPTDTPPGALLQIGETWRQDGLTMSLERFGIMDKVCETVFSGHYVWGGWNIVVANHTDQDLLINLDEADFFLVDDRGKASAYTVKNQDDCVPVRNRANIEFLRSGEEVRLYVYGLGKLEDQAWFEFSATKVGRIENARWRIDIPR